MDIGKLSITDLGLQELQAEADNMDRIMMRRALSQDSGVLGSSIGKERELQLQMERAIQINKIASFIEQLGGEGGEGESEGLKSDSLGGVGGDEEGGASFSVEAEDMLEKATPDPYDTTNAANRTDRPNLDKDLADGLPNPHDMK
jgi:hypothetical protein